MIDIMDENFVEEYISSSDIEIVEDPQYFEDSIVDTNTFDSESSSVSDNSIDELLNEIRDLNYNIERSLYNDDRIIELLERSPVLDSTFRNDLSYNQIESIVSMNSIMDKPINEYDVSESLMLMILLVMFVGIVYFAIKKGVPRWR